MVDNILVESSGATADVRLDTWLKDLLPRTPGAVRPVVKRELVLAVREFYTQSLAWRVVIGPKNMKAGKKLYTMSPYDAYADVVKVFSVELEGSPLRRYVRRPAGAEPAADRPTGFFLEDVDNVRLWPAPVVAVDDGLTFYVALTPKQTVTHLPRMAMSHHYDALLDGALGRLYNHPAKPYTDPLRSSYHLRRFRGFIAEFRSAAREGNVDAPSWTFPKFGR